MKKFIKGTPNVRDKVDAYKDSLLSKYKINSDLMRKADLIMLDGFVIKDRYNPEGPIQSINTVNKAIIGGCDCYGNKRLYVSFNSYLE